MKILMGGPTVDDGTPYFKAHLDTLRQQRETFPADVKLDIVHLDGHNPDGAYKVTGEEHKWDERDFEWMGHIRQSFLRKGLEEGYDAVFMCDTDLLLGPGTLNALIAANRPITYGVFWTQWPGMREPLPQVWDMHPAGYAPGSKVMSVLMRGGSCEVLGGGACTLIWSEAILKGARYYPRLQSLPHQSIWRGEDRTFNLTAEVLGIQQWAVGGLNIRHLYTEMQRTQRAVDRELTRLYNQGTLLNR